METKPQPVKPEAPIVRKENLSNTHFEHVVVFGQGPVQEQDKVPSSGREGLNFYSRMLSLSAAQMLKDGVTDKVILTGGATGARAGTPEAQTEADLMADIIRRRLTTTSSDAKSYIANGKKVEKYDADGKPRPKAEIDAEVEEAFSDRILIENKAQDTLQNFAFIINKYLDNQDANSQVGLLGISFHAKDTYNGTGIGRLEAVADIFGIKGRVFSAEEVVKELIANTRGKGSSVREQLLKLANMSTHHEVSQMKSIQENLLIDGLRSGEWMKALPFLEKPDRVKEMLLKSEYASSELQKKSGATKDELAKMTPSELLDIVSQIKVQGTPEEYGTIKAAIFEVLSTMTDEKGTNYLAKYGKGTIPK